MDITVQEDVGLAAADLFERITDTATFERQALRRGAELRRLDRQPRPGPGAAWHVTVPFRGRRREMQIEISRMESPSLAEALIRGGGMEGVLRAECVALSRTTTRLTVHLHLEGRTLPARLLVQSFRLARASLERRAADRLSAWARSQEAAPARRRAPGVRS
ncbi:SRPBCC family protein [Rubellimicrobium sp. CFH 75288]|uniref:SRPBCC family protein n=1 Tax=Rubellimicrobium sp. CFH 75288 TaxID=2697034 RepID=UPI001412A88F|nr:SRPBCC family protein [Rubellimicrobium sp. CFH 75288]NAZ35640.1 SRPBCC family protein [Rubellimicrobium sp. CFH 75288]